MKHFFSNGPKNTGNILLFRFISVLLSNLGMMICIVFTGNSDPYSYRASVTIAFFLFLIGTVNIFYLVNQFAETLHQNFQQEQLITKQNANMEAYVPSSRRNSDYYELIHNAHYYYSLIYQYARDRNFEAISQIINEMNDIIYFEKTSVYSEYHLLNSILTEEKKKAEQEHVSFDVYIEPYVRIDLISDIDLMVLLGNLLENAITAAAKCEQEKYIKLYMFTHEMNGFCILKIENSYTEELISNGTEFFSTKKDSGMHGLGIKSINKIAEKYGGYVTYIGESGVFKAIVLLDLHPDS